MDNVPDLEDEDEQEGRRQHCWVLVKSGNRNDDNKDFFIEPSTGTRFNMDEAPYEKVVAVFNNRNYFLNMFEDKDLHEIEWNL